MLYWSTLRVKMLLTIVSCSYGKKLQVYGHVDCRVKTKDQLKFGDNVMLISSRIINPLIRGDMIFECIESGEIYIGDNSGLSAVIISSRMKVSIGFNVAIGANVQIFDHDFHSLDYLKRRKNKNESIKVAEIIIEDDVFIGCDAIILKGTHIGARSILGAGTVVSNMYIPPDSIVVGNPGKIIKNHNLSE
ncbi:MAG: acyltransferase [Mariprofundaceae bacterium]|nr:acyltransferase [Mariprofundaceae bacterium]